MSSRLAATFLRRSRSHCYNHKHYCKVILVPQSVLISFRSGLGLAAGVLLLLVAAPAALASLSQGYATTSTIPAGSLVALDSKSAGVVDTATLANIGRLFGVVVPPASASISLSGTGSGQVQVGTTGSATVFVTNAAGNIHVGDYLTVSPIAGVAEEVGTDSTRVIGTAQADFSGTGSGVTTQSVTDATGHSRTVAVGQIPILINVSSYTSTAGKQPYVVPNWLQNLSNTLAGKAVSPIRIVIASLILLVALMCITVLLYSAVRNSIISIGRNPLSRSSVLRGLFEVVAIAGIILAVTAAAMYVVISK